MKTNYYLMLIFFGFLFILTLNGCDKNPKVISPSENANGGTGIFSGKEMPPVITDNPEQLNTEDLHTVTILEVLPTVKYVYLRVKEGQEEFWIATLKTEIAIGEKYFYRGGLLKTNFESREHQRIFDKMYLVSSLIKADHGMQTTSIQTPSGSADTKDVEKKGVIRIADLAANPKKYAGKTIQIHGNCVKVNSNIMGRNWIHIQDGSRDDYDLVITSQDQIPVGHTITMSGKVVLDKDFGSGYKYSIILEEGELVQ